MNKAEIYSKILEVSEKSYYRWKSKDHPILINLIEKYFSDDDLEEFFTTGKIKKFEEFEDLKTLYTIAIKAYFCFSEKLLKEELKLFLEILYKLDSNIDDRKLMALILESNKEIDIKVNLLQKFSNIENKTLFFYGIKYLLKNKFKDYYNMVNKTNLLILHMQLYIEIFLNQKYITYEEFFEKKFEYIKTKENIYYFDDFDINDEWIYTQYIHYCLYSLIFKEEFEKEESLKKGKLLDGNNSNILKEETI